MGVWRKYIIIFYTTDINMIYIFDEMMNSGARG